MTKAKHCLELLTLGLFGYFFIFLFCCCFYLFISNFTNFNLLNIEFDGRGRKRDTRD